MSMCVRLRACMLPCQWGSSWTETILGVLDKLSKVGLAVFRKHGLCVLRMPCMLAVNHSGIAITLETLLGIIYSCHYVATTNQAVALYLVPHQPQERMVTYE